MYKKTLVALAIITPVSASFALQAQTLTKAVKGDIKTVKALAVTL